MDLSKSEEKKLEKLLLRFKDKYEPLTVTQANTILTKNGETEVSFIYYLIIYLLFTFWLKYYFIKINYYI